MHVPLTILWISVAFHLVFKHTTTLFALSDHYVLSREWRVFVEQVQVWCYNQPGVTKLLIMRDPHYGWMCFK